MRYVAACLVVSCVFAAGVSAQQTRSGSGAATQLQRTPTPTPTSTARPAIRPVLMPYAPGLSEPVTVRQASATGRVSVAPSTTMTGGQALSSFVVNYRNGDHKLNAFSMAPVDGNMEFRFVDQDGNDPYNLEGKWYQSTRFLPRTVSAIGSGEFDIPIAKMQGYTPVLTGFALERKDGTDANVRTLGVRMRPDNGAVRVVLMDDQGADFRGFEMAVAAAFVMNGGDPFGAMLQLLPQAGSRVAFDEISRRNGLRQFKATVSYVMVPDNMIKARGSLSGSTRHYESGRKPGVNEKVVLRGFLYHFVNSDHHLLQIGANPGAAASGNQLAYFQDGDREDPKQWNMDYVVVE